jgi:DNA invertase Pin-like site-specific DNA recombinase
VPIAKQSSHAEKNLPAIKIALYARVSTEAQEDEGQSLGTQVSLMQAAAARVGAHVVRIYQIQESAMPGQPRPSLTQLMKDAAGGQFEAVMVCKLDRLARAIDVLTHVENQLRQFGIDLYEGVDKHNLISAEGRLTRGMQALIGEYAVNRLKWSACLSRLERAQRGWPHSGSLPWGREVIKVKDRRHADAQWVLNPQKAQQAQEMYASYMAGGLNLAQAAAKFGMHAETFRRILADQSGGQWERDFLDPTVGQKVKVITPIPPLLTDDQIAKVRERGKQNQMERVGWAGGRQREYPLSHYLRCPNPKCGWSNLSGHLSKDRYTGKRRPYYVHISKTKVCGCTSYVPAEDLETELFAKLGELLSSSAHLTAAIRATVLEKPEDTKRLESELVGIQAKQKRARKTLENAMAVLIEQHGSEAAAAVKKKIREQEVILATLGEQSAQVEASLKVTRLPADFPDRVEQLTKRLTAFGGKAAMFWPHQAKRALLALFFGGPQSTRFDRAGSHVKSDARGIFITEHREEDGKRYWTYEARGSIANLSGAITRVVELYDHHNGTDVHRAISREELAEISNLADRLEGYLDFRVSQPLSRPTSASACRGTAPPVRATGSVRPGTSPRTPRARATPGATGGNASRRRAR